MRCSSPTAWRPVSSTPASASRSRSRAGSSPQQPAHAARLQDHHRHAVGDGVVQLAGDPRALLDDRGAGLLLALELDAHDVALGRRAALLVAVQRAPGAQASR